MTMIWTSAPAPRRPLLQRRYGVLLGAALFLALLGVELALIPPGSHQSAPTPASPAAPAVDPRLIVHGHSAAVSALLDGATRVSGTLAPSLPGANTLRLALHSPTATLAGGHVDLVVTMPGMAMAPIYARLPWRGHEYRGAVALPMFGRYHAAVTVAAPAGTVTGAMTFDVPLPNA